MHRQIRLAGGAAVCRRSRVVTRGIPMRAIDCWVNVDTSDYTVEERKLASRAA